MVTLRMLLFNTIFIPLKRNLTLCHYLHLSNKQLTYTHIGIVNAQNRAIPLITLFYAICFMLFVL